MKKILFFVAFLLWAVSKVLAQQHQVESLQKLLQKNNDETIEQLQILNQLSFLQANINLDDALTNAEKALLIAQKINNQRELAVAFKNKGYVLMLLSKHDEARALIQKSMTINSLINNKGGIADDNLYLGEIAIRIGKPNTGKIFFEKAFLIYEKLHNDIGKADCYYYLARVYQSLGKMDSALINIDKGLTICNLKGDELTLSKLLMLKGNYLSVSADYVNAILYLNKAILLDERNGNIAGLSRAYGMLALCYDEKELTKNIYFQLKSVKLKEQRGDLRGLSNSYRDIGETYLILAQYDKALFYTNRGLALGEETSSTQSTLACMIQMGAIYKQMADYMKAFEYRNFKETTTF